MTESIRFIDLFGGIGGFRHGLEQASDRFECVDYIEYDEYAVKSYNEIFGEEHEPRDVTQLSKSEIRDHDLLCAGFPCQSFSVAGNRQGTDEARGKLFREIVRIAEAKKPSMLLLENVKGILSQKVVQDGESVEGTKGHAFTEVLQALHELGYCLEWQVLNSKHWGVPQNRERVFIIGHLGGEPQRKVFPIQRKDRGDTGEDGLIDEEEIGLLRDKGNFRTKEIANCLDANYWKGMDNRGARTQIIQNHRNIEIREHGQESPTLNKKQGGGQLPMVLNHQFRPETWLSIEEEGQSGGLGLLHNSDYSYALSSSPHYLLDDSFLAMEGELRTYTDVAPSQRSERQGLKVVEVWDDYNSNMREDGNTGTLTKNFGVDATRNGNKIVQIPRGENGGGLHSLCPTVSSNSWQQNNYLKNEKRIRKLTPKECWRLQGFPDESFEAAQKVNSDTQLYKQAGNAVTVNVIKALGEKIEPYFER